MSESTYTPGPWKAIEWNTHAATTVAQDKIGSHGFVVICECSGHGRHSKESLADARLIAAAPELFEVLEELAELDPPCPFPPSDGRYKEWFAMWGKMQGVINKAKGVAL